VASPSQRLHLLRSRQRNVAVGVLLGARTRRPPLHRPLRMLVHPRSLLLNAPEADHLRGRQRKRNLPRRNPSASEDVRPRTPSLTRPEKGTQATVAAANPVPLQRGSGGDLAKMPVNLRSLAWIYPPRSPTVVSSSPLHPQRSSAPLSPSHVHTWSVTMTSALFLIT